MSDSANKTLTVTCVCGETEINVTGDPVISVVCACNSCRTAGRAFEQAAGAPSVLRDDGGTDYCLYRKDRMRITAGLFLQEHRLTAQSKTRRVVARCCNTPMFLDFTPGHWVTLYRDRLAGERPPLELRTMGKDAPPGVRYADGIPTYPTQPLKFIIRLLSAWAAMRFRRPKLGW